MASGQWRGSTRRNRLPADWPARRAATKRRARGRCEWMDNGLRCVDDGSECDHIIPGENDALENLQWLCTTHHSIKSAREGVQARAARQSLRYRKPQRHPGLKE